MLVSNCSELVSIILSRRGVQFIGMDTLTKADIKGGKKCPYYGAMKYTQIGGMIGASYERLQNKELQELGLPSDYVVGPRLWGHRIDSTPFVVHTPKDETTPKVYLEVVINSGRLLSYVDCNGGTIADCDIAPHLNAPKERKISLCDYALNSIQVIRIGGKEYTVDHHDIAELSKMF